MLPSLHSQALWGGGFCPVVSALQSAGGEESSLKTGEASSQKIKKKKKTNCDDKHSFEHFCETSKPDLELHGFCSQLRWGGSSQYFSESIFPMSFWRFGEVSVRGRQDAARPQQPPTDTPRPATPPASFTQRPHPLTHLVTV